MLEALLMLAALFVTDAALEEHYLVNCEIRQAGPRYTGPDWTPLTREEADRFEPGAELVRRCSQPVRVSEKPH